MGVCCIIRVSEETQSLPTKAYCGVDVVQSDGRHSKEFAHIPSIITASEAEEVGVEHLLREVENISLSTLTTEVNHKLSSLNGLTERLMMIRQYLQDVVKGALPINQDILRNLQLIFNLLPNLNKKNVIQSFQTKKNDLMLNIYIASLLRSILALDNLLENRIENKNKEDKKEAENRKKQEKNTGDEEKLFEDAEDKKKDDKDDDKDKKKKNKK